MPRQDRRHRRHPQPEPIGLALLARMAKALEAIALSLAHPPAPGGSDAEIQKLVNGYTAQLKEANDRLERRVKNPAPPAPPAAHP